MTAHPGDPVLAASQMLGELAQIYFEYPNLSTPRAVVAVPPTGSSPNPTMIGTLLTDLSNNPFVQGVTTAGLFQTLSTPAACHGGCKLTSSSGSSTSSGLPVSGIRNQRNRIAGLASAIPAGSAIAKALPNQFSDLVLASESENRSRPSSHRSSTTPAPPSTPSSRRVGLRRPVDHPDVAQTPRFRYPSPPGPRMRSPGR